MNQSDRELAALGRIIRVIKRFQQLIPNSKPDRKRLKEVYLKQHLSGQDWKFWKQLQADPVEVLEINREPLTEKGLTRTQFSLLLGQYRRVGLESYQGWCQTQQQIDFGLGDPLPPC